MIKSFNLVSAGFTRYYFSIIVSELASWCWCSLENVLASLSWSILLSFSCTSLALDISLNTSSWTNGCNIILTSYTFKRTSASLWTKPITMWYKHLILIILLMKWIWIINRLYLSSCFHAISIISLGACPYSDILVEMLCVCLGIG